MVHEFLVAKVSSACQIGPSTATTDGGMADTMSRREE